MVPMCQRLIDASLLTEAERSFINRYHAEVVEKTSPYFAGDDMTLKWLHKETRPI